VDFLARNSLLLFIGGRLGKLQINHPCGIFGRNGAFGRQRRWAEEEGYGMI
jgi:hypothetical protein